MSIVYGDLTLCPKILYLVGVLLFSVYPALYRSSFNRSSHKHQQIKGLKGCCVMKQYKM